MAWQLARRAGKRGKGGGSASVHDAAGPRTIMPDVYRILFVDYSLADLQPATMA